MEVSNSAEIEFEDFNSNSLAYDMVLVEIVEHLFEDQRSSSTSKDSNGLSPTNCIKFLDTAIQICIYFSLLQVNLTKESSNSKINGRLHDMDKSNKRRCRNIIVSNIEALKKLGHYLPGMLYMKPDFYWGVDRLFHLEKRLLKHNLGQLNHQRPLLPKTKSKALKVQIYTTLKYARRQIKL